MVWSLVMVRNQFPAQVVNAETVQYDRGRDIISLQKKSGDFSHLNFPMISFFYKLR